MAAALFKFLQIRGFSPDGMFENLVEPTQVVGTVFSAINRSES